MDFAKDLVGENFAENVVKFCYNVMSGIKLDFRLKWLEECKKLFMKECGIYVVLESQNIRYYTENRGHEELWQDVYGTKRMMKIVTFINIIPKNHIKLVGRELDGYLHL